MIQRSSVVNWVQLSLFHSANKPMKLLASSGDFQSWLATVRVMAVREASYV
jgi:hypothetical protein